MSRLPMLSIPERLESDPLLTGRGVCIAFVDTGFYPHPDLLYPRRRIRAYADVTREVPQRDEFFTPHPYAWHGTMTACCAVGSGHLSGGRYRGLAHEADAVLLKAGVEQGRVVGKHVASALRFPLRHPEFGIRVLNVSLGVDADDPDAADVERAVAELVSAGVVVVAAAGNRPGVSPETPGSAPEAITVGGQDDHNTRGLDDDTLFPGSAGVSRGVHKPELLAPAISLPAPMLPGTPTAREAAALFALFDVLREQVTACTFSESSTEADTPELAAATELLAMLELRIASQRLLSPEYQHVQGTSFAAPITASVVALMLQAEPSLTPAQVREGLLSTAVPLPGHPRASQGAGVLRALEATRWAQRHASQRR